jgi:short-subunit dehydrogenase
VALSLDGARVLLTGASAGIGAATAPMLAERGATLALTGRRADRLDAVVGALAGDGHVALAADLAEPSAADDVLAWSEEALGHLDAVVHNAATPKRRSVTRLTLDELDEVMAINFRVPARMTLSTLPGMLERARGSHVFVSSVGGRLGIAAEAAYCASKFALAGWAEAVAIDLWDAPVDIHLVVPGPVDTEIWDRPGSDPAHYQGPLEPAATVAAAVADTIESDVFEVYSPDLRSVVEAKTRDPDSFLAGVAAMAQASGQP